MNFANGFANFLAVVQPEPLASWTAQFLAYSGTSQLVYQRGHCALFMNSIQRLQWLPDTIWQFQNRQTQGSRDKKSNFYIIIVSYSSSSFCLPITLTDSLAPAIQSQLCFHTHCLYLWIYSALQSLDNFVLTAFMLQWTTDPVLQIGNMRKHFGYNEKCKLHKCK